MMGCSGWQGSATHLAGREGVAEAGMLLTDGPRTGETAVAVQAVEQTARSGAGHKRYVQRVLRSKGFQCDGFEAPHGVGNGKGGHNSVCIGEQTGVGRKPVDVINLSGCAVCDCLSTVDQNTVT